MHYLHNEHTTILFVMHSRTKQIIKPSLMHCPYWNLSYTQIVKPFLNTLSVLNLVLHSYPYWILSYTPYPCSLAHHSLSRALVLKRTFNLTDIQPREYRSGQNPACKVWHSPRVRPAQETAVQCHTPHVRRFWLDTHSPSFPFSIPHFQYLVQIIPHTCLGARPGHKTGDNWHLKFNSKIRP